MAEQPTDHGPPDESEDRPPWMTPEGRLKEIPFKYLSNGEEYSSKETYKLMRYWTRERASAVGAWVEEGTPADAVPACLPVMRTALETDVFDLRGFMLYEWSTQARTPRSARINLSMACLDHAFLERAHLEHADLSCASLDFACLLEAHLEHASLENSSMANAVLDRAHLEYADLRYARLQHAYLSDACLDFARLTDSRMEHAQLHRARLHCADLEGAHLEHAELTGASVQASNLSYVYLGDTVFRDVKWRDERRRDPEARLFRGFDVRGICYSDPLFDRWVRQSNFIMRVKENWPKVWWWWNLTCKCGRSIGRWALACGLLVLAFGLVFCLAAEVFGFPLVRLSKDAGFAREPNPFTYFYFSVVTFTTLGFGDVRPTGLIGEILVTFEVIFGYVGLGGLISIFTTKLIPPQ